MPPPPLWHKVDPTKLCVIGKVQQNKHAGLFAPLVNPETQQVPQVQLATKSTMLVSPFGCSEPFTADGGADAGEGGDKKKKYNMDVAVPNSDPRAKWLRDIDNVVKDQMMSKSVRELVEYFPQLASVCFPNAHVNASIYDDEKAVQKFRAAIEMGFNQSFKPRPPEKGTPAQKEKWFKGNYDDSLRVKVQTALDRDGNAQVAVDVLTTIDGKDALVTGSWSDIKQFARVMPIVALKNIWFMNKSDWGVCWELLRTIVQPNRRFERPEYNPESELPDVTTVTAAAEAATATISAASAYAHPAEAAQAAEAAEPVTATLKRKAEPERTEPAEAAGAAKAAAAPVPGGGIKFVKKSA